MGDAPQLPDWTGTERWAWESIAAGKPADFNARAREADPDFADLDPRQPAAWSGERRLRAGFLQAIVTRKPFVEATPFGGVRILGALVTTRRSTSSMRPCSVPSGWSAPVCSCRLQPATSEQTAISRGGSCLWEGGARCRRDRRLCFLRLEFP